MHLSYRARRRIRKTSVALGYILLIGGFLWGSWAIWLERFVVYGETGARLEFDYVPPAGEAQVAEPPEQETVAIHYNEGTAAVKSSNELTQLRGYYATVSMLSGSVEDVAAAIEGLPAGSPVMLDVKSRNGYFYYSTNLDSSYRTDSVDTGEVDELIRQLKEKDVYLIARIPALRDYIFPLKHTSYGLPVAEGYLWYDENNNYYLDPSKKGTVNWLIDQANELRDLGFDEVVFTDYYVPEAAEIVWSSEWTRQQALESAAQDIVDPCATATFAVSFETTNPQYNLPEGRSRLYLTGIEADQATATAALTTVADKVINLVYTTESSDTRYDAYSVMRPLPIA